MSRIELKIVCTGKGYGKKDTWEAFEFKTRVFPDIKNAIDWVNETYGKARRTPMYVDTKEGIPKKIGYIIGFRNSDISHYPVVKWIQRDWIEFRESKELTI